MDTDNQTTADPPTEEAKVEGAAESGAEAGEGAAATASPPQPKLPSTLFASDDGVQAILPRDLPGVAKFAQGIIASGIVPKAFKYDENVRGGDDDNIIHKKGDPNEPLIIMGILKSLEIGLPPLTGLSYLLPINDRFTVWGDGGVALAQSKGLIEKQTRAAIGPALEPGLELKDWPGEYGVEVRYWRKGQDEPYVGRYTVADARRAGLWMNVNKQPWIKYPDRMLFNRARAFALRDGFADALSGLAIAEEVLDMSPAPVDGGELTAISAKKSALDDDDE